MANSKLRRLLPWDTRFMRLAREWALLCSKDPNTQVGAVLVGANPRDIALGYNGFPPGIADDERMLDRDLKNQLVQHAERNVLDNAKFDTRGATIYATFHICSECAKSAISKGVTRVVCPPPADYEPWKSRAALAQSLLKEAGVELTIYEEQTDET